MERIWRYEVTEEKCIENYLRENLGFTKHQIRALKFRENGIRVNGVRRRVNDLLKKGMCLELCVEERGKSSSQIVPGMGSIEILYEDEDLLVVNKPSGILVHPSGVHYADTLVNQLAAYFFEKGQNLRLRPVGRLDKDTSGAVLFAKSQLAAAKLSEDKEKGGFEKEYLALVRGIPERAVGQIDAPIGRADDAGEGLFLSADPNTGPDSDEKDCVLPEKIEPPRHAPLKMQIDVLNGKEARTIYQVVETFKDCALVKIRIDTGRTHQIRVHMAYMGHPLLGDPLYGRVEEEGAEGKNAEYSFNHGFHRAALHAARLTFRHPFSGELMEVEAPLPADFEEFIGRETGWPDSHFNPQ